MLRLLLTSVFLITCSIDAQNSTIDSIIVEHNNVSGGGFQSDVTVTDDGLTVYSSADVSGIFKSTDGGLLFENINKGLKSPKVASLVITPDNDQILYAGTGDKGGSGGLFRSINGGDFWELTGAGNNAQFAGNHSAGSDPLPSGHPRSNGDLIIVNEGSNSTTYTDDIVITGTYKDGVRIFSQGGEVEESSVNTTGFVRSVAYNAAIPNTVYAAIYFDDITQNGIYKIDYTNLSAPISTLEYQTQNPEGITVLSSGRVYAAIGDDGIVKYNGTSWSLKNTGLSINNTNRQWTAVTGYLKGTNDVIYAGTNNLGGNVNGTNYSNIWRSVNGGNTWTPLVDANTNVSDQIYGQSYDWWYRTQAFPQGGLGRKNSVVSSIDVARGLFPNVVSDDIIYVSGRGGIWKSDDGGDLWKPAVYNMQATANNGVAVNPNNSNQVAIANTDYVVLETSDTFENNNISRDKPSGAESRGYDVIFDITSDELILGVGDRDTNNPGGGEVYVKSAATVGNPSDSGWTNTNLVSSTSTSNGRVRAVTFGYHNGNSTTSQTILAAVEGEGVFRYHNGSWSQSNGITIGSTKRSNFVWPDNGNSGIVYLLDLSEGLYRSDDGGQNWSNIWTSMNFNNNDFYNTGYITADDNDPTTLYLSIQGGSGSPIGTNFKIYRMIGANSGTFGAPGTSGISDITFHSGNVSIARPGPLVFGPNGRLWLTQQQNSANSIYAGLFVMENPTTDLSFIDLTTNAYKNIVIQPSGIDVSSDGYVYISQNGTGLIKIKVNEDTPTLNITENQLDQNEFTIYPNPSKNNFIYIKSNTKTIGTIEVYDITGNILLKEYITSTSGQIDINKLSSGIYIVKLQNIYKRFIVR
ncbi:T9SS type A sorting domain-containing protein [Olleya sp. R77988]|uniref:T9SS type A sorting domain-containing protein n=1 Tax=Olleya sp. R77988 TaxID=3093875 RepID=UPI0037CCADA7